MSIAGIIRNLADKDIRLWLDGDVLRYDAPAGGLPPDVRAEIVARKAQIVDFLRTLGEGERKALPRRPEGGRIPLSVGQERLWFLFKLEGPSSVYNVMTCVELDQALDAAAYRCMLADITRRHQALRTRFAEDADGVPYAVVEPAVELTIPTIDLSGIADARVRGDEIRRIVVEEETRRFDLASGPLLAASLIRLPGKGSVVLLNCHHIAVDAWSMGIIGKELHQRIAAAGDRAPPVSAPPVDYQYADFAYWQTQRLASGGFDGQLDYWENQLRGVPPLLDMPTDYPRPDRQRFKGLTEKLLLPADTGVRMRALCRGRGATLFMGLLAAYDILISRYSGREDIVVGSALSARTHPDMHGAVGMFTNTVTLRNRVDGAVGFLELLDRVRLTTLEAQANQDVPFRAVVERTVGKRSLSHSPLYQVSFALNNAAEELVNAEIALRQETYCDNDGVLTSTVKDDLSLQVRVLPQHLELKLSYDTALFSRGTALRMLSHYRILLDSILASPERPVRELRIVDQAERDWLIAQGQNPMPGYPSETGLHELFAAHCASAPDAIAVQHDGFQLSYLALDRWSDALAVRLLAAGVGLGHRVGLCVKRTPEIAAGILAILKLGACYVPLDRAYPAQALDQMIEDSELALILHDSAETPWSGSAASLRFDRSEAARSIAVAGVFTDAARGGGDLPAYVNYTSGSTGRPKGVEVKHRNVVRLVCGTNYVALGAEDVFPQISNHSFDAFTFEVWGALLNGGRLVHADRDDLLEPERFGAFLRGSKASAMFVTAALFGHIVHVCPTALRSVRNVLVGGDVVGIDALRRIHEHGRPERLLNGYGPTENTTFSTTFEYGDPALLHRCTIGTPIGNSTAYVLDDHLDPVPRGVTGDLYVGGDGVAIGYVRRPDQTASRFLPDPHAKIAGGRMYRTGDRVRWNEEGQLEFLGRLDNQVKIRGFRIETGEIENRLSAHPEVRDAAVLVETLAGGDKRLVAYLSLDGGEHALERVRRSMKDELPDYKQPSAYLVMERLPLNQNGKIDRARLPAFGQDGTHRGIAPRDAVEKAVAEVWCELLGRERVCIDDNFFELGGHSLMAITASVRFKDRLGVQVGTRDIFELPVLADLAEFLRERPRQQIAALPPLIHASRRQRSVPSFAQQRLWFVEQIEGPSALYHMPMTMRLDRRFGEDAVRRALAALQCRHESLRTAFTEVNGIPRAVEAREMPVPLRAVDLGNLGAAGARMVEQRCEKLIGDAMQEPFDLAQPPLYRALLLHLPDGSHLLALTLHHAICDGWSMGILQRELAVLLDDPEAALAPLAFDYGDYSHWYRAWLDGGALAPHIEHWRARLRDAPPLLSLRPGEPRPAERRQEGRTIEARFSEELILSLEARAGTRGCTLFMAMLAAFKILLARHSGGDDIVVGTPAANRPLAALEGMVGLFVNMLALRTRIDTSECFDKLQDRVRETALEAYEHQGVPFEQLIESLGVARNLSYAPLIQIVFAQENFLGGGNGEGVEATALRSRNRTAKFDLNVAFERLRDGARLYFEYDVDLYSYGFVHGLIEEYRQLLQNCVEAPDIPLARLLPQAIVAVPAQASVAAPPSREPPRTQTEQAIAAIWSELLKLPSVARGDNFFALGGHSLLASQACAAINERLGTQLRIRTFYASQDLGALAEAADAELGAGGFEEATAELNGIDLDAIDVDAISEEEAGRLLALLQERGAG
ncbi:amino acid adenylation domain-containing protein [Xanthomonas sp. CFBP 8703]|uniref:Amino acid adenylation domain-containing protein n=1 Tax=Xanthomonas bonasiae TaxID=2810351 RepID=A0ABS3AW05_9XANT|nr:non-ribosomal peptide synthetase [Xanthomonas bonasiae]MBN6100553.1 amino acid adenylation domain-containing protein [Xanthomonas bonasiae]